ncbi:hypothetical protein SAMN04488120_103158 [Fontimonas thermophila]|uniref:Uncharacterized protein n=1 Tax=Fontimonas thermophila TaxID=1076937 RepID=A0A1I2IC09_9GAMM|nr:hypothetical protein [Fontimonas thermophila]SFF39188.1 hypothetical protein SAMN04488120_103158 [Fontimonas thermophila]
MRLLRLCVPLLAAGMLAACGDDDDPPAPQASATARVLAIAAQDDEVGEPFPVNDGAFVFDDTAETTEPVSINR